MLRSMHFDFRWEPGTNEIHVLLYDFDSRGSA